MSVEVVDEPVGDVESGRERRLEAVAHHAVGHDAPDRLAEHRHEAEAGRERQLPVVLARGRVDDHERGHQRSAQLRRAPSRPPRPSSGPPAWPCARRAGRAPRSRDAPGPPSVALARLLRAAVPEQVEPDHVVVTGQRRDDPVPPADRAGKAVQQHDVGRVARPVLPHLQVAAGRSMMRPTSALAALVSRSVTTVLTASSTPGPRAGPGAPAHRAETLSGHAGNRSAYSSSSTPNAFAVNETKW